MGVGVGTGRGQAALRAAPGRQGADSGRPEAHRLQGGAAQRRPPDLRTAADHLPRGVAARGEGPRRQRPGRQQESRDPARGPYLSAFSLFFFYWVETRFAGSSLCFTGS